MEQILYIPSFDEMLKEYRDADDLRQSYEQYGCGGLEIIRCNYGQENQDASSDEGWDEARRNRRVTGAAAISPAMIRGVHMIFYSMWLDFWKGNEIRLLDEFGDRETWEGFYMGKDRSALLRQFKDDMEYANLVGAEYVVFHVSEVTLQGVFTHEHIYDDEEVIDTAIELINMLLDGTDYHFYFLMENLWWPGLTMTNPAMTKRLLDGVHYEKKGIMLDLGHLMCTNTELKSEDDAIDYICEILDAHGALQTKSDTEKGGEGRPLTAYIKGVHMHQSVTGEFAKNALEEVRENGLQLAADYYKRFSQAYKLLGNIDTHKPFTSPRAKELMEKIAPDYVVHEVIAQNRGERDAMLAQQSGLLTGLGSEVDGQPGGWKVPSKTEGER